MDKEHSGVPTMEESSSERRRYADDMDSDVDTSVGGDGELGETNHSTDTMSSSRLRGDKELIGGLLSRLVSRSGVAVSLMLLVTAVLVVSMTYFFLTETKEAEFEKAVRT